MKKQLKSILALFAICAVTAVLLAITNHFTLPLIEKNEDDKANEALLVVLPNGKNFERIDISEYTLPNTVVEVYSEKSGGYVFKMETSGYSSGMIIMCGINSDGTVSGATCLSSGETLGYEKTYGDSFKGKDLNSLPDVNTISGATKTTVAYKDAVKDALNAFTIIRGGSVDLRSDEEILADNLATALPDANGKFKVSYADAFIIGEPVSAVYTANNGSGHVYVIGKNYIGVDTDGNILTTDVSDFERTVVVNATTAINMVEDIDISEYNGIAKSVKDARRASDGTLFLEVHASGYGINGGDKWHPASGKPIVICLSVSTDGSITKCVTMQQDESAGFGAACGDESFYSQFNGKTEASYESVNVDAISNATMTREGYMTAIKQAFDAMKILNGGMNR